MSALGSSVINKSTKKFAPKAPARRTAPTNSDPQQAKPSSDRRTQSQTPQPQSAHAQVGPSPSPSISYATAAVDKRTQPQNAGTTRPSQSPAVTADSLQVARADRSPSAAVVIPQKRSLPVDILSRSVSSPRSQPEGSLTDVLNARQSSVEGTAGSPPLPAPRTIPQSEPETETSTPSPRITKRQRQGNRRSSNSGADGVGSSEVLPTTEQLDASSSTKGNDGAPSSSGNVVTRPRRGHESRDARSETEPSISASNIKPSTLPQGSPKRQRTRASAQAVEEVPATHSTPQESVAQPSKPVRRRKKLQNPKDAAAEIVNAAIKGVSKQGKRKYNRKRSKTPEDAEHIRIAPSEIKMAELCNDSRTGKTSAREKELRELDRASFVKKKQNELKDLMAGDNATPSFPSAEDAHGSREIREIGGEIALDVPNTIIVDGQIQIDESSLRIDRHAAAAVERDAEQLEGVEENEFTRKVNSASWLKREKGGGWNRILLDRFYDGLRMFGTDFGMISTMFPGKSRHAIKLKFCREEKDNAAKIKAILLGEQLPVDLDEFQKLTGTEYGDPAVLERELEEDRKILEEEQAAEQAALEKVRQERAEQVAAEKDATTGDESSTKENRSSRRKKNKKGAKGRGERGGRKTMTKAKAPSRPPESQNVTSNR